MLSKFYANKHQQSKDRFGTDFLCVFAYELVMSLRCYLEIQVIINIQTLSRDF